MTINQNSKNGSVVSNNTINTIIDQIDALQQDLNLVNGRLDALDDSVETEALTADEATIVAATATSVSAGSVTVTGAVTSGSISTGTISGSSETISGTVTAGVLKIGTDTELRSDSEPSKISVGTATIGTGTITNLSADEITTDEIDADEITTEGITNTGNYSGVNVTLSGDLTADDITADNVTITEDLTVKDITVSGTITGISDITLDELTADEIESDDIKADNAELDVIKTGKIIQNVTALQPTPALDNNDYYTIELPAFTGEFKLRWNNTNDIWYMNVSGDGKNYSARWSTVGTGLEIPVTDLYNYDNKLWVRINCNGKLYASSDTVLNPSAVNIYYNEEGGIPNLNTLTDSKTHYVCINRNGAITFGNIVLPEFTFGLSTVSDLVVTGTLEATTIKGPVTII